MENPERENFKSGVPPPWLQISEQQQEPGQMQNFIRKYASLLKNVMKHNSGLNT
jgi:hypothetical protein